MKYVNFPPEVYDTWNKISPDSGVWYECLACGRSHSDCLHHIFGRGPKRYRKSKQYASILNSCPLNNAECHIKNHSKVKGNEELLRKVFKRIEQAVRRGDYEWTERDREFYKLYEDTYKKLNCFLTN